MKPAQLTLRPATDDDVDLTFAWANDAGTRSASFTPGAIDLETHTAWFARSLAGARRLYLAESEGRAVGLLRFDSAPAGQDRAAAEISLTVAPECRGRGIGTALLVAGTARARTLGHQCLVARVRRDNGPSRQLFEAGGFAVVEEIEVSGVAGLVFLKELADA